MSHRRLVRSFLGVALCLTVRNASAAEGKQPPASDSLKVLAPFVNDDTLAVAHVDISRLDAGQWTALLGHFVPARHLLRTVEQATKRLAESFHKAGGHDFYVLTSVAELPNPGFFVVIPVDKDVDENAMRGLSASAHVERIGKAVFIGHRATRERLASTPPTPRPELQQALNILGDSPIKLVVMPSAASRRVVEELMPALPVEAGGGPTTTLTRGALWVALGAGFSPRSSLRLVVQSQTRDAAHALQNHLAALARERWPRESREPLLPALQDDRLVLTATNEQLQQMGAALWPWVRLSIDFLRRRQSTNQLKRIAIAMHNYSDVHGHLPPPAIRDATGQPLLSWRVAILPYLEQQALYERFHLDEPWNSEHNRPLVEQMPEAYRSFASSAGEGRTSYLVATGPEAVFDGRPGTALREITDGTAQTLMAFESDDEHAVVWTKPEDFEFDAGRPAEGFGSPYSRGRLLLFCDGSVQFVRQSVAPETIRRLILRNDGHPLPPLH